MRVFVTGATGRVGVVVEELLGAGPSSGSRRLRGKAGDQGGRTVRRARDHAADSISACHPRRANPA